MKPKGCFFDFLIVFSFFIASLVFFFGLDPDKLNVQAASSFRFISWADTKSNRSILSQLSDQAVQLNLVFTIYPGDLESSGFTLSGMDQWKAAMNGQLTAESSPNGMFDITFPVRGNHDKSNSAGWQNYFDLRSMAARVGATNYTNMTGKDDLVYSFDYGNSHIVGLDVLGDAGAITSDQISWLDSDLASAEARGLTHAFIYFHGPIYCVDGHCGCSERVCSTSSKVKDLITVLNKHPIMTASFHGHEHTYAYTYLDETRIPPDGSFEGITHPFHQFVTGDAGAGSSSCKTNRCDFVMREHGFVTVDVSGNNFTVTWYKQGSMTPYETRTFNKTGGPPPTVILTKTPTPTNRPTNTPTPTKKPTSTPTERPTTTATSAPTPPGTIPGDIDADGDVDIFDYNILVSNFGATGENPADIDGDNDVDIFDYNLLVANFGKTGTTQTPTIEPTATLTPTSGPTLPPPPPGQGIWISPEELSRLPTSGSAWSNVKSAADQLPGMTVSGGHDSKHDVHTLAGALVAARLNDDNRKRTVADEIMEAVNNQVENDGNGLSAARTVAAYILAADIIDFRSLDPVRELTFHQWVDTVVRKKQYSEGTLVHMHRTVRNNRGNQAGVARIAAAIYLGDRVDLDDAAKVLRGWIGDYDLYHGFTSSTSNTDWHCDLSRPVGLNAKGCTKEGHSIDGVLPEDQRRAGGFRWPPPKENYVYEGLQGVIAQAVMLHRAGFDVWNWQDKAFLRAFEWLHQEANYPAEGDDTWQPHIVNYYYGSSFPAPVPARPGKNIGWTDWTHAR